MLCFSGGWAWLVGPRRLHSQAWGFSFPPWGRSMCLATASYSKGIWSSWAFYMAAGFSPGIRQKLPDLWRLQWKLTLHGLCPFCWSRGIMRPNSRGGWSICTFREKGMIAAIFGYYPMQRTPELKKNNSFLEVVWLYIYRYLYLYISVYFLSPSYLHWISTLSSKTKNKNLHYTKL